MFNKILILLVLLCSSIFGGTREEEFIRSLIYTPDGTANYVDPGELTRSERLDINYNGVKYKWLIGFDIDEQIKSDIKTGKINYEVKVEKLDEDYSRADFKVAAVNYSKSFYFRSGSFIPNSVYFTRNWKEQESKYFIFRLSEPKYFNDYCVRKLDEFVDKMADTLGFANEERSLLEKEKLYYTFCKDENEVEQLTGYKSKGQAILAYDEVITAFQTHYHEVVHLLVNYKLKNLGLYTLPFFMEGFAVAMGGRGGMAPRVVTDLGYYLQKTGFLTHDSILTYDAFMGQDANLAYAVSGLYNSFLVSELGIMKYMELYKSVNGDMKFVMLHHKLQLPDLIRFQDYLDEYNRNSVLIINQADTTKPEYIVRGNGNLVVLDKCVKFFVQDHLLVGPDDNYRMIDSISRKYIADFGKSWPGAKYCISVDSNSIVIIDLYSDETLYSFKTAFSLDGMVIPRYNGEDFFKGQYVFFIKKELFGPDFDNAFVITGSAIR